MPRMKIEQFVKSFMVAVGERLRKFTTVMMSKMLSCLPRKCFTRRQVSLLHFDDCKGNKFFCPQNHCL